MAKSPFEIELSEEEERELRSRAARYTTPFGAVLRARIVLLAAEEETNAEIARGLAARCGRCRCGGNASSRSGWTVCVIVHGRGVRGVFPPEEVARVKAIACELPRRQGVPLSRFSRAELHRLV